MTLRALLCSIAITGLVAGTAHADGEMGFLVIDSTLVKPIGEDGKVSNSLGYGAEFRLLDNREVITMSIGGYYALGQLDGDKTMRDIYDFHFNIGVKPERTKNDLLIPFLTIGLDVLAMTTREPKGDELRGTTLGLNASGGVMGYLGDKWLYRASVSYLGAIVPGTGDDLGGVVLQLGIGRAIFD